MMDRLREWREKARALTAEAAERLAEQDPQARARERAAAIARQAGQSPDQGAAPRTDAASPSRPSDELLPTGTPQDVAHDQAAVPDPATQKRATDNEMVPASAEPVILSTAENAVFQEKRLTVAQQELRLVSAMVLLLGIGVFLALPFVLSAGSVLFLPLTTALILFILLAPLADKLSGWGLPNMIASLTSILLFFAILLLALALVLQPAASLLDELPLMAERVGERFAELQDQFSWVAAMNERITEVMGQTGANQVVMASPSMLETLAFATPTVVLEVLITLLMTFFLIVGRVQMRQHLFYDRVTFSTSIKAARVLREIQGRVAAYISTVALINTGVGVVVALGAWALGVDAPIMWGGLAAILNFVPYIGPLVMTVVLSLFGIGTTDTVLLGLVPAAAYLALHTIEANVITPFVLGARFTMNPVMILIALSYFSWIWGVPGALLSVPLLLMVTALFDHIGKPNLIGFMFGEPLFATSIMDLGEDAEAVT